MDTRDERNATIVPRSASRGAADPILARDAVGVAQAIADPSSASHASLMELQHLAGNAVVSRLVARTADDDASQGADERSPVLDVVGKGGGRPIEPPLRTEMESRLGADFGDVRIHSDPVASRSAEAVNAYAYTVGNDVVFRSDRWNPESSDGRLTLAHELTHVMQQRSGPISGTPTGDGIRLSDPGDSFERAADANARSAMTSSPPAPVLGTATGAQREIAPTDDEELEDEEEEGAQGDFVQREAAPEEEEEDEEEAAQGDFVQREAAPEEDEEEEQS
jgi:hypothetical protein